MKMEEDGFVNGALGPHRAPKVGFPIECNVNKVSPGNNLLASQLENAKRPTSHASLITISDCFTMQGHFSVK
jgi:hypothetical protein